MLDRGRHKLELMSEVYLVGVAGRSGSGKSELAYYLAARLGGTVLSLDHYYRDLALLPFEERARQNFDHPDSIDFDLVESQLAQLKEGAAVWRPDYDFATHTRRAARRRVQPGALLLVDGIFALHPRLLRLYDTRVYVDLEEAACLERRLARDTRERGRTEESVRAQWRETVEPMSRAYVLPCRDSADVVVRGDWPLARSAAAVAAHLAARREARMMETARG